MIIKENTFVWGPFTPIVTRYDWRILEGKLQYAVGKLAPNYLDPTLYRKMVGSPGGTWDMVQLLMRTNYTWRIGPHDLDTWLITMVIVSPVTEVIPLLNGLFMAYK